MTEFRVDSYKFLPRSFRPEFEAFPEQPDAVAPARPTVPLRDAKVALLTSAGLYLKDRQPPFDLDRERREPWWGDPSYRLIPRDAGRDDLGVAHFHINPDDILEDFNIALPIEFFGELTEQREIGALAENHYSFMGYQGESLAAWQEIYGPELAQRLQDDSVNYLVLTPV